MSDQITIVIPEDATMQILDTLLKSTKTVNGSSAYEVLDLIRSWRQDIVATAPAVSEDQPKPRVGALALAPDWDDKTNNVVIERVDANGCQVTNSQGQSWWVGMDRIEVLADSEQVTR